MINTLIKFIVIAAIYVAGISAVNAQTLAGQNRPATVPADFVITPYGYFHQSCVRHLADGDELQPDQHAIRHANGTMVRTPACAHPHYRPNGTAVVGDQRGLRAPDVNGWVGSASTTTMTAYRLLSAEWSVPYTPASNDTQVLFYFTGLEDIDDVETILQPVLGWNSDFIAGWGIASWNCCESGTVFEGPAQPVSPGDTIYGVINCATRGNPCRTWNVVTTDMQNGKSSQLLQTSSFNQTFNWAFGGVLEVYRVKQCTDFPGNGLISFHDIQLVGKQGRLIANPKWTLNIAASSLSPQCNYSAKLPKQVILGAVQ